MIAHQLERLLVTPFATVEGAEARQHARFLALFYVILIPLTLILVLLQSVLRPEWRWAALAMTPGMLVMFAAYGLARSRHYRVAAWLTMGLASVLTAISVVGDPGNTAPYAYLLVPVLLASVLFSFRAATGVAALNLVLGAALAVRDPVFDVGDQVTLIAMVLVMTAVIGIATHHRSTLEEQRRAQLEARDHRQSALLEAGFGGMALLDDGTLIECSRGFAAIFGLRPEEMLGAKLERFLTPTTGPMSGAREAVHRDGRIFPVEVVALPYDELGGQRAAVAIRDTTEHRRLQAQLHQADRMATMGQLAAGVAHEINNPLAWVVGNLDLLAEQLDGEPRATAIRAAEGARRVDRIVRDLKTFSRTRPPEPASVDLKVAVGSAVNMIRHQLRDRGALIEDYSDVPPVDGDETRIGQVCLNLLVNAVESLPEGQRDQNRVEVRLYTDPSGEAVIEVADNGTGIPADVRHRMFEPFFTTKSQGTGLGLSITRSITASLGGRLAVESREGVGTTMRIVLPPGLLAGEPVSVDAPLPIPTRPGNRPKSHRILVVDDERDILELMASVLDDNEVITASGADDALRCLSEGPVHAVLCDLMMPERTGMDLYRDATARWPELADRFAFVTGGAYTHEARTFLDRTDAPVLHKPFALHKLRALVEELIDADHAR